MILQIQEYEARLSHFNLLLNTESESDRLFICHVFILASKWKRRKSLGHSLGLSHSKDSHQYPTSWETKRSKNCSSHWLLGNWLPVSKWTFCENSGTHWGFGGRNISNSSWKYNTCLSIFWSTGTVHVKVHIQCTFDIEHVFWNILIIEKVLVCISH